LRDLVHWADEHCVEWDEVVKAATEWHDREVSGVYIGELGYQLTTV
jgi:hypothetical protein